jgi:hypothetical protein
MLLKNGEYKANALYSLLGISSINGVLDFVAFQETHRFHAVE